MHSSELSTLLVACASIYDTEGRPEAQRTATALLSTLPEAPMGRHAPCLYDSLIRSVLASSAHPAARALLDAQSFVPWGTNPVAEQMTDDAASICAVAELMGPEGPIPAADFRLGFLFQRPESYYPLHNHDADETYVILAGRALWTAGDDVRMRGPGDMIHHPSLMPHAFRTAAEGLVAVYRWSGDVNAHSYTFLPDPGILTD